MPPMTVLGVDLSGPANAAATALVWFRGDPDALDQAGALSGADDRAIVDRAASLGAPGQLIVGLDAPLSYNMGGGDRRSDALLRARLVAAGLAPGTVMAPTMTRMAYLTLRGLAVARALQSLGPPGPRIVEVHPAAALVLRGADARLVRALKRSPAARRRLLAWLEGQGLGGVRRLAPATDHLVAACASALAAWRWGCGAPAWVERAAPPWHPFDYAT